MTDFRSKLSALGVSQILFGTTNQNLPEDKLKAVRMQCNKLGKQIFATSVNKDEIVSELKTLQESTDLSELIVGWPSTDSVSSDNAKLAQACLLDYFRSAGLSEYLAPFKSGSVPAATPEVKTTETEKKIEEDAESDSDSSDEAEETKPAPAAAPVAKEDSDSDSDSDSEEEPKKEAPKVEEKKAEESDSDSDSDSDEEMEETEKKVEKKEEAKDSDSDSDSSSEEEKPSEKEEEKQQEEETPKVVKRKRQANQPFRRVKSRGAAKYSNQWNAGTHGEHGAEAFEKLGRFRGADFIKAKNKRKRSNRSGFGKMSLEVNSIDLSSMNKKRKLK